MTHARPFVLLVEDDADSADAMRRLLVRYGAEAEVATSGRAALEIAKGRAPDLVLVDLRLPDLSGVEVVATLLRRNPGTRPVCVALSGAEDAIDEARRFTGVFDRCLLKPVEPKDLRDLVEATLPRSS
jgi:CheY-like chemotaxis protein